jgi:hypothetical protein
MEKRKNGKRDNHFLFSIFPISLFSFLHNDLLQNVT